MLSDIMLHLGPKQAFADALVQYELIPFLLRTLEFQKQPNDDSDNGSQLKSRWSILESLASNSSVAVDLVNTSGWLELLGIIAGCDLFTIEWMSREASSKVLARLLYDPQISTTAGEALNLVIAIFYFVDLQCTYSIVDVLPSASHLKCFIPSSLLATLKSNGAEAFLVAFDEDSENPELLWDASTRIELRKSLSEFMKKIFDSDNHRIVAHQTFDLPQNFKLSYSRIKNELCIGDVFVEIYLRDPSYDLRDSSVFLEALLFRWSQEMQLFTGSRIIGSSVHGESKDLVVPQKDVTELVMKAIICACKNRPFLCLKLVPWGYTKSIVNFILKAKSLRLLDVPLMSPIRLLHLLSTDQTSVEDIISTVDSSGRNGVVDGMMKAIDGNPIHPEAALMIETLKLLFQTALGDLHNDQNKHDFLQSSVHLQNTSYVMAPSPAPGSESVSKMKKMNVNDPLSMMLNEAPVPKKKITRAVRPNQATSTNPLSVPSPEGTLPTPSNFRKPVQNIASQRTVIKTTNHQTPRYTTAQTQPTHAVQSSTAGVVPAPLTYQPPTRNVNVRPQGILNDPLSQQRVQPSLASAPVPRRQVYSQLAPMAPQPASSEQRRQYQPIQNSMNNGTGNATHSYGQYSQGPSTPGQIQSSVHGQQYTQQRSVQGTFNANLGHTRNPVGQYRNQVSNPYVQASTPIHQYAVQRPVQSQNIGQVAQGQVGYSPGVSNGMQSALLAQPQRQPMQSNLSSVVDQDTSFHGQSQQGMTNPNLPESSTLSHQYRPQLPVNNYLDAGVRQEANQQIQYSQSGTQPTASIPSQSQQGFSAGTQSTSSTFSQSQQLSGQNNLQVNSLQAPTSPIPTSQTVSSSFTNFASGQSEMNLPPYAIRGQASDVLPTPTLDPETVADEKIRSTVGAPNSAPSRNILLDSALSCKLHEFLLLSVLENPEHNQVKDWDLVKLHSLELLRLLMKDPGYGMKFEFLMNAIPSWKSYKN